MAPLEPGQVYLITTQTDWSIVRLVAIYPGFIQALKLSDLPTFDVGGQAYTAEPTVFFNTIHIVSITKVTPKS